MRPQNALRLVGAVSLLLAGSSRANDPGLSVELVYDNVISDGKPRNDVDDMLAVINAWDPCP